MFRLRLEEEGGGVAAMAEGREGGRSWLKEALWKRRGCDLGFGMIETEVERGRD